MDAPDVRLVLGRGGQGKSTLVRSWLAGIRETVLIFDPNREPKYARGAVTLDDGDPAVIAGQLAEIMMRRGRCQHVVWPGLTVDEFEGMNRVAWAAGDLWCVWEEVDQFMSGGSAPPWSRRLINQGRHRDVRIIAISRRPATVARSLTANASRLCVFGTREPRDLKYLAEFMGEEAAAAVARLADHEYLDWTPAGWSVKKTVPA